MVPAVAKQMLNTLGDSALDCNIVLSLDGMNLLHVTVHVFSGQSGLYTLYKQTSRLNDSAGA